MRKSYLFVAVAGTILASCAQSEKLNIDLQDNEQAVIGFASYSEKTTKGVGDSNDLEYYHNTFAVYGTKQSKNDLTDIQYLFGGKATASGLQDGVTCSYQDPSLPAILGDWRYDDPRFWDKQATFDFIAYAPVLSTNPIRYYYNAAKAEVGATGNEFKSKETYTLKGTNIQATPTTAEKVKGFNVADEDLDLMVSAYSGSLDGATHSVDANLAQPAEYVNLIFRHILSKLNVKVAKGEGLNNSIVTVKEVTIKGFKDSGDYTSSTYVAGDATGWTASSSSNNANYKLTYEDVTGKVLNSGEYAGDPLTFTPGAPYYFIESIIMPQGIIDDQVEVTVKYKIQSIINGLEQDFTYKFDLFDLVNLRTLKEGYNYTLTCTIQPEKIKFDATASSWDNVNVNKDIVIGE